MGIICQILFDNNDQGVYYAGQTISGLVTLNTDKAYQIKAILMKVKGYAESHWTESRTDSNNKSSSESYRGFEKYISSTVYLLGSSTSPEMTLEPGTSTYNFATRIPINCPSSFEGTHGRIIYNINVKIVQPWKYDSIFSRAFTVVQTMDLTTYESISKIPVTLKSEKTFGVWPFRSDPLSLELTLPVNGFLPGQSVPLKVLVGNDSNIKVHEVKVGLAMMVTYYCDMGPGQNLERLPVVKMKSEGVLRNSRKLYDFQLLVPPTPPSSFGLCRIIKIGYQVEVVAKVKGMHINATLVVPVTICGVPIMPQTLGAPQAPDYGLVLVDKNGATAPVAPPEHSWPEHTSLGPPSYAEAMHITTPLDPTRKSQVADGSTSLEEKPYKPLYPVYNVPPFLEDKKEEKNALNHEEKK
ncbi:hypothetical protein KR009_000918 [Drosophila setifemur]|nr:hypothetical protein KR009_000918 [Drosophila setifemur]